MNKSASTNPDKLKKFVLPASQQPTYRSVYSIEGLESTGILPRFKEGTQVPPTERAELGCFQTVYRGSPNLLSPQESYSSGHTGTKQPTSLKAVWEKGLFSQAPEVADINFKELNKVSDDGKVKIVRYQPEKFERGRVQRPKMWVEEMSAETLYGDGESLTHPAQRRQAHDAAINSHEGERALKEACMAKNKLMNSCRMNFPHGALGVVENPYTTDGQQQQQQQGASSELPVYNNREEIQRNLKVSQRKGRGGSEPLGQISDILNPRTTAAATATGAGGTTQLQRLNSPKRSRAPGTYRRRDTNIFALVG